MECHIHEVYDGAATWPLYFAMKGSFAAAFNARMWLRPTSSSRTPGTKEGMLMTYLDMLILFLQTYAANDFIAQKMNAALEGCTKAPTTS